MKTVNEYQDNPEARYQKEFEWLKQGDELDSRYLAEEFDISPSTAREDLSALSDRLGLEPERGDHGRHVYSLPVDDPGYLEKSEVREADDIANYLFGEASGMHRDLNNDEWEEKESMTLLTMSELGWGTKFSSEEAVDALAYKLEEKIDADELDPDENFGIVMNGGVLPRISKWNYKTARHAYRALAEWEENESDSTVEELRDTDQLAEYLEDENIPDDPEEREEFLAGVQEKMDEVLDGNENMLTNLQEASEYAEAQVDKIYDALGAEADLYMHMGEQDEANIEDMEELKIQELTDEVEDRMETLQEKIDSRNDMLQTMSRELADLEGEQYDEVREEIEEHLANDRDPRELELEDYDIDSSDLETYEEALEEQEDLIKEIREMEHNRNAMLVEKAFGEAADWGNRKYLPPDKSVLARKLAELEYEEYYHQIGNVEEVDRESDVTRFDVGGFTVDLAHKLHYTNTPLKTGFKKEKRKYKDRQDEEADLFLTGHHGPFKAQQFVHGRGEDENDHTWMVQLSTFMDPEKLEENGLEEGLTQLQDVKRMGKGLFDSTVSLINMTVEEGPDGELRKRFNVEGWDGEYLKRLGEQLNGEKVPGKDFADTDDRQHVVARGDDQIGAQHDMEYIYEPLTEEVIAEDFHNIDEWMDGLEGDATVIEVGDAFQGTDVYDGQQQEGSMYLGMEELDLKSAIISVFEDEDVEFESKDEFYDFLQETDLSSETQMALDYADHRDKRQVPVNNIAKQGELVEELLVDNYEELIDRGADMIIVDGNHYNDNLDGLSESERLLEIFDSEYHDEIRTGDGNGDGDGTFYLEGEDGETLQVRAKHRPTGYGAETVDKLLDQAVEQDTDLFVAGHLHVPSFGKQNDLMAMMPGSAQATNDFVKGFTDAPAEKGAVYLSMPSDPDKKEFEFEHVSVKGLNPLTGAADEE
ncbi:MAG: hypothetical protein SV186_07095 [Candidatus Nanohaloarchaea archaeon]|nr:hypothetical protein [Candidatus Nanohaloarchaea archaeon]